MWEYWKKYSGEREKWGKHHKEKIVPVVEECWDG